MQQIKVIKQLAALCGLLLIISSARSETYFTVESAQQALFKNGYFEKVDVDMDKSFLKQVRKETTMGLNPGKVDIWQVSSDGDTAGWFFVAEVLGKHENIRFALALDVNGYVRGIEIMDYRETLGSEVKDAAWRSQFYGKSLASDLKLGRGIDNISGATLSCRHLADGIHGLLMVYDHYLKSS